MRFRTQGPKTAVLALLTACLSMPLAAQKTQAAAGPKSAKLTRGRYLVENVLVCHYCHSKVDWHSPEGGLPIAGTNLGGNRFPLENFPFPLVAPNVSADKTTGAGAWSDAQLANAIRNGIGHDGRVLFPVMPFMQYRSMSDADLAAVIAYVRSLPAVKNDPGKSQLPPPVAASLKAPPRVEHVPVPDLSNPVKRGEYLATLADCVGCHTPVDEQGVPLPGLDFSGGQWFKGPWGEVASANITPDASGISYYTEKTFVTALRTGHVGARRLSTIMPWGLFKGMTDQDLKSIYAYLKTVKPIQHRVDNTEPVAYCKICRAKHGGGELNH